MLELSLYVRDVRVRLILGRYCSLFIWPRYSRVTSPWLYMGACLRKPPASAPRFWFRMYGA